MGISKTVELYTDGACSQNGTWKGGWGVVVVDNEENVIHTFSDSAENTTNNAMELSAFQRALAFCHIHDKDYNEFIIYSDSAYILNCFSQKWYLNWRKNGWRNAKKEPVANKELWESILWFYDELLSEGINLTLVKVKGHSGNKYNELADKLAVEASK